MEWAEQSQDKEAGTFIKHLLTWLLGMHVLMRARRAGQLDDQPNSTNHLV